jgi:hypothetical protein
MLAWWRSTPGDAARALAVSSRGRELRLDVAHAIKRYA